MTIIDDMLHKTSRTFALAIPLLPEPTRTEVGVAYLLVMLGSLACRRKSWRKSSSGRPGRKSAKRRQGKKNGGGSAPRP